MSETFFVYILTNQHHNVFYVGVTNDLIRRIYEHKNKLVKAFSYKHNVDKLMHYEAFGSIELAILHEKRVKRWARTIKCDAINRMNPEWVDLYDSLISNASTSATENVVRHPGLVPGSPTTSESLSSKNHGTLMGIPGRARDDASSLDSEYVSPSQLENA